MLLGITLDFNVIPSIFLTDNLNEHVDVRLYDTLVVGHYGYIL